LQQAAFNRVSGRDRSRGRSFGPNLGVDGRNVPFDGPHADEETLGDLLVALTLGDQAEHFGFASRQIGRRRWRGAGIRGSSGQLAQQPGGAVCLLPGTEPSDGLKRLPRRSRGRGGPADGCQDRSQLKTAAGGFEGGAAVVKKIDRVFERAPRGLEIARSCRDEATGKAG
jgi:hypothetical protein